MDLLLTNCINWLERYSKPLLIALFSFFSSLFLWQKLIQVFTYASELGGFERNVVFSVQYFTQTGNLYMHPEAAPYSYTQYMPFFYLLSGMLAKLFGFIPFQDSIHFYWLGRCINFSIILALVYLLYSSCLKFNISKIFALFFAILWFLLTTSAHISGRPDMLKIFFFILAFRFSVNYAFSKRNNQLMLAWLMAFLAFFTKQDGLFAFGIPLAFLIFSGQVKKFILGFIGMILSVAITFLIGQTITQKSFVANVIGGIKNGISISWFQSTFSGYFQQYWWLFVPALVFGLLWLKEKSTLKVLGFALVIAFVLPLLSALKYGSAPNYFNEFTWLAVLAFAILTFHFITPKLHKSDLNLLGIFGILVWFLVPSIGLFTSIFMNNEKGLKENYFKQKAVAQVVKNEQKQVLCLVQKQWEDHLSNLIGTQLLIPQRDVSIQVFDAAKGIGFDHLKKLEEIDNAPIIISDRPQLPEVFLSIRLKDFQLQKQIEGYYLFEKRK